MFLHKMKNPDWTRGELLMALSLYWELPFGQFDHRNSHVIEFASVIGRSAGGLAMKLSNFASLDENERKRGVKGLPNTGRPTESVWREYLSNPEKITYEAEQLLKNRPGYPVENIFDYESGLPAVEGYTRDVIVKQRVNQQVFRRRVLAAYDSTCCITGLSQPDLIVASHIRPWAVDKKNRLNPRNGLALNALHDRAFDRGFISIAPDLTVRVSSILKKKVTPEIENYFLAYEGRTLRQPRKFPPDVDFLAHHYAHIFKP